jgi:hypothetical protein
MKKVKLTTVHKIIIGSFFIVFFILVCLNPGRGDFNRAVFEGGKPNPITPNQEIMQKIIEVDRKYYQNENDSHLSRSNYVLFSIYNVKVNQTKTYHVLGILGMFRLLDSSK